MPFAPPDWNQPIEVSPEGIHAANLYFDWGQKTVGFGQLHISKNKDGTITADTENMGKEWMRKALYAVVDALVEEAKIR